MSPDAQVQLLHTSGQGNSADLVSGVMKPGTYPLEGRNVTILSLIVFFGWIFPANEATDNWTTQPEGWELLRRDWEFGHAVNAALVACALLATALATVRRS